MGDLAPNLPVPGFVPAGLHEAGPGHAILDLTGLARVRVARGDVVAVEPAADAQRADLDWLLDGPVREVRRLQRGGFALRAAAVSIGGRAVALIGPGAAGKSCVAAALAGRGHPVLADSVLPVDGLVARATCRELQLWPEAVVPLGLDTAAGEVVRPALAKRAFAFSPGADAPLTTIALLERTSSAGAPSVTALRGRDSFHALARYTSMYPLVGSMGLGAAHFAWVTRLAAGTRVVKINSERGRRDPHSVADAVEELIG